TGIQVSAISGLVGAVSIQGSVKRAKYHEESTNVSIVSVSRRPGAPQDGQGTYFQVGWRSSGLPGRSKSTSSGSVTGRSRSGTGPPPHSPKGIPGMGQPQ